MATLRHRQPSRNATATVVEPSMLRSGVWQSRGPFPLGGSDGDLTRRREAFVAALREARRRRGSRLWLGFIVWQSALLVEYYLRPGDGVWLWPIVGLSAVVAT